MRAGDLQANRDPEFAVIVAAVDAVRQEAFVALLDRIGDLPGRRPAFPAAATARWIQGLVDAAHLTSGDASRDEAAGQLRRIVDWLLGR